MCLHPSLSPRLIQMSYTARSNNKHELMRAMAQVEDYLTDSDLLWAAKSEDSVGNKNHNRKKTLCHHPHSHGVPLFQKAAIRIVILNLRKLQLTRLLQAGQTCETFEISTTRLRERRCEPQTGIIMISLQAQRGNITQYSRP